jgi:hypothetical protein
VIELVD